MTGREIAAAGSTDKDEILELVDRAEDVGRQLDEIAQRQKRDPLHPNRFVQVSFDKKH